MTCYAIAYLNTTNHFRNWNSNDLATGICNRLFEFDQLIYHLAHFVLFNLRPNFDYVH